MADKSKNNSKFKSSSTLDDISASHNMNKTDIQLLQETIEPDMVRLI